MEGIGVGWGDIEHFFICYILFVWRVAFSGMMPLGTAGVDIIDSTKISNSDNN